MQRKDAENAEGNKSNAFCTAENGESAEGKIVIF